MVDSGAKNMEIAIVRAGKANEVRPFPLTRVTLLLRYRNNSPSRWPGNYRSVARAILHLCCNVHSFLYTMLALRTMGHVTFLVLRYESHREQPIQYAH